MPKLSQTELDELVHFLVSFYAYKYEDAKYIRQILFEHAVYNTLMIVRDKDEKVIAVARWNILPTLKDLLVLDLVIHPKYRRTEMNHRMILRALEMYPEVKYIIYERRDKNKKFRKVPVQRFLKRRF